MATRTPDLDLSEELLSEFGGNASYVAELLARYRTNPAAVDDEWRRYFRERFGEPEAAVAAAPASPATPLGPAVEGERVPIRGGALRIAENMEASLGVPTATTQRQVPIKLADENRRLINDYRAASEQPKVSFTHLVSWAVIQALKAFPGMNDAFDGSSGEPARVRRKEIRFGLAVDVAKSDGTRTLFVPNVKGVEQMTFAEFAAAADDVVTRARTGKIEVSDFEGTTVSLTRHARDDGLGAPPDARAGSDYRDWCDRIPGGILGDGAGDALSPGDLQGRHVHVDLRPPHHPGGRVRGISRARRRAASGRARLLRGGLCGAVDPVPALPLVGGPESRALCG
jgi:2-oxoglutarate dehydrogenase E1 component